MTFGEAITSELYHGSDPISPEINSNSYIHFSRRNTYADSSVTEKTSKCFINKSCLPTPFWLLLWCVVLPPVYWSELRHRGLLSSPRMYQVNPGSLLSTVRASKHILFLHSFSSPGFTFSSAWTCFRGTEWEFCYCFEQKKSLAQTDVIDIV